MATISSAASHDVFEAYRKYVVPNYIRYPVALVRGEGSYVWDSQGNRYLDLFPGWGCNLLGHCPPAVVEAVTRQLTRLIHVPNTWHTPQQAEWAEALSRRSFGGQAFFCNSGAEANEAAIKLARLHTQPERYKIICFEGGFHGRTLATTTATAQPKYHEGLGPLVPGFVYAPWEDAQAVADRIDNQTAAILVEPVQGEGGIRIPSTGFLQTLRKLADDQQILLMFDEVQTGCGRTGHWFAYQHFGVTPDVMTLAKGLCGGLAGAALLTKPEIARSLRPGMHAATFGGNPIAAAAGVATIEAIEADGLLERAGQLGDRFRRRLDEMASDCDVVLQVRQIGLMIGIELAIEGAPVVEACLRRRLLVNATQRTVIRLLPAMTLSDEQADQACDTLAEVLRECGGP
jgi:predicted acetylornithine/succinylornithine family transaminase